MSPPIRGGLLVIMFALGTVQPESCITSVVATMRTDRAYGYEDIIGTARRCHIPSMSVL